MITKIVTIDPNQPDNSALKEAGSLLSAGELVAFPTETVYGLGADAFNVEAVSKIFAVKGRPADNPLIVHISSLTQLTDVATLINPTAQKLIDNFWPGPLSLVLPKNPALPAITTAGLETVVVRMPKHAVARQLINYAKTPISAPSANLSGTVSTTTAQHVFDDFAGKIPLIIDAGPIECGIESTVVDCTTEPPVILRPGSITYEELRQIIPEITTTSQTTETRSPGMKYRHYATTAPITLFVGDAEKTAEEMCRRLTDDTAIIFYRGDFSTSHQTRLPEDSRQASALLFATLREVDKTKPRQIFVQGYPETNTGIAIMNRLRKAASLIVVV